MFRLPERALWPRIAAVFAFRFLCFMAMVWLTLLAESRPAPHLPDAVIDHVPYMAWVDRYNFVLWVLAYLPVAFALLLADAARFCRYMVTSGLVSVLRGVCILATGLGPVRGADVNAGMDAATRWRAFWEIVSPVGALVRDAPHVYLTKDLFFSGHTATTAILLLYVWRFPHFRWWMLAGHVLVVASIFLSHLHYTIDVIGGWAIAFCIFVLREADVRALLRG
ncbi:MAG: hypothetical protein IRZ16_20895 [Myxococcaceae bacterium]|nr:hypothetical protein [Myxococcaceae bacterium]